MPHSEEFRSSSSAATNKLLLSAEVISILQKIRHVDTTNIFRSFNIKDSDDEGGDSIRCLLQLSTALLQGGRRREADALQHVYDLCLEDRSYGGLGFSLQTPVDEEKRDTIAFQVEAWLESLNSEDKSRQYMKPLSSKPATRRPMTLSQKILAHHAVGKVAADGLAVGDLALVSVDWVVSSELAWEMLQQMMDEKGATNIFRNDRLWLAGDHRVDPRNYQTERSQRLIASTEKAKQDFKLTDYKGSNYTIIHTEFVRERAEPGGLVVGADSHTCSAGAVGCLSIGLGGEDVVIPLITGEGWFKVPECIDIQFVGQPLPGIGGKDVILYILKELKRNTVAANRIVEFSGPGLKHLSTDARFAIANMCTEFGAVTGIFVPDEETRNFIGSRGSKRRSSALYFKPDEDAEYAQTFQIDLSQVKSFIALYPSPDNVVAVTEQIGKKLDGCFIGACTTTEEDLVLAGLILKAGLAKGLSIIPGTRHVTPGSLPVVKKLESLGLLDVYAAAGFTRGAPGCSYCVGVADTATPGSVWLSSQNRNFPNRMGKGSIANLAAATTVAASSFSMTVTDPSELLREIDHRLWNEFKRSCKSAKNPRAKGLSSPELVYVEPAFDCKDPALKSAKLNRNVGHTNGVPENTIKSRVVTLGDFIDTDALSPSEFILSARTDEALGEHCLQHTVPDFRARVKSGATVVVAGKAFGVGSSRETAPRALKGLGVKCVIARSFAFIYARNQPNIGLLGIVLDDNEFHALAVDGAEIEVDLGERKVLVGGREFSFKLDDMELALVENGGMTSAYRRFGNEVFHKLTADEDAVVDIGTLSGGDDEKVTDELQW